VGEIDRDLWAGRRVFVTGHTGFKGAWLVLVLARLGAVVRGYALAPHTEPNLFDAAAIGDVCEHAIGDVRDSAALAEELRQFRPEIVFHLAAQSLVRQSYREPLVTLETNVLGTANLLEACRFSEGLRAVVNVTTDKCYEDRDWVWGYRETDRLGGNDPYSGSKACAELVTTTYRQSFFNSTDHDRHGVTVASARAGNVIGGGDWNDDRIIPDAVRAFTQGHSLAVRNPDATRPWQHVLDPLFGYLVLAQACVRDGLEFGRGWNFGPGERQLATVRDLVEGFRVRWAERAAWHVQEKGDDFRESHILLLDSSLARDKLGWTPRFDIDESLDLTEEWYSAHRLGGAKQELRALAEGQIDRYLEASNGNRGDD
jgi:CDP-glucose 4,6-dehydratase